RRVCDADPKSDGLLAVAERVLAVAQPLVADRLERPVVERLRPGDVADADRDMVEHARVLLLLGRSADTARRPRHDPTWPLGWPSWGKLLLCGHGNDGCRHAEVGGKIDRSDALPTTHRRRRDVERQRDRLSRRAR